MRRIDPDLLLAAEGLGAPGWQIFRRIYFPLTLPGVLAGTTLVFILSIGFYITPALLGGGRVIMIAVLIETAGPPVPGLGLCRGALGGPARRRPARLLALRRLLSQRDCNGTEAPRRGAGAGLAHRRFRLLRALSSCS